MFWTIFFTLLRWIRKKPCFSPTPSSSNEEKIFQTESYQYSDPHPWEPISMNFPLQKTDRKNLVYLSRYPWFITFFVNREIMTFEVVKMTSYKGGVKLWEAVKSVLEEIFPNPLAWWKSRLIPFIKAKVAFFENSPRPERVKIYIFAFQKFPQKFYEKIQIY